MERPEQNAELPILSVILPVYNAAPYLEIAVRSILSQTFRALEVIAVNDGSTDSSGDILDQLAAEDQRLNVVHKPNAGVSVASNTAIALARGAFIARMDGDDIAWPEKYSRQVAYLDAHPEVVLLGTQFQLIDPKGRPLRHFPVPLNHDEIDRRLFQEYGRLSICAPTSMMRADALRAVGGYNEDFTAADDVELFLRLAEVGRLANLDEVLFEYRQHLTSIGHAKHREQKLEVSWSVAQAAARRGVDMPDLPVPDTARPKETRTSDIFRKWGWWALMDGNIATARYYAGKTLRAAPLSRQSWTFAFFALRGH